MFPILWSGQSLRVVRCTSDDVSVGDIAIGHRPDGVLVAHVVASVSPVRLSSFFGHLDPVGTEILGRANAVRVRSGRVIPLPYWSRRVIAAIRTGLGVAIRIRVLRLGTHVSWSAAARLDAHARTIVGAEIIIRDLLERDLENALALAGDVTGGMHVEVEAALRGGRVRGLYQGRKLRALALRGPEGRWRVIHPSHPTGVKFGRQLLAHLKRSEE